MEWRFKVWLMTIVFPFALLVFAFSWCDVRQCSSKHACKDGSARDCLAVGHFYEERDDGLFAFLLSNGNTAEDYYHRGCKLGDQASCARFGYMVVVSGGDNVRDSKFELDEGIAALAEACAGNDLDACRTFAGAVVEPERSIAPLSKLCDSGDKDSCDHLLDADAVHTGEILDKLCNRGDHDRCIQLGNDLLGGTKHVNADPARGDTLLAKECEHGEWRGCRDLGEALVEAYGVAADPPRAIGLFTTACDHGNDDGCFDLGKALLASDAPRAMQLFSAVCDKGIPTGCDALGDIYRVGVSNIARDREHAHSLYQRACDRGGELYCLKRDCLDRGSSSRKCELVRARQPKQYYRLGGNFDM